MKRILSLFLFALFSIGIGYATITLVQDQCVPYPNQTLSTLSEITLTIDGTDEISAAGISPDQARLQVTTKSVYVYEDGVAVAYANNTDIVRSELGVMTITLPLNNTLSLEKGKEYTIKTLSRKIRIQNSTGDWNSSFLAQTQYSFYGNSSGGTDFGNVAITLNPEDSKFADGATFDKIEASAWADKGDEALLQPGDAGTWYYNITSDKVDPLPEMYVTYKFKALDNQEWASDNNGEIGFRIAKKTDNGYLCHLWTNYAEPLLNNRTVEFTVEVRENADGKLLASQTSTWTGTLKATLTAKKLHFNPASESELDSKMTIVTLTADEPLSKAIAYSPELTKTDEETMEPIIIAEREDYKVSKVSDTEWLILLEPSDKYFENSKGDIRMAVTAWDANGVRMLYDEYVTVLYSYPFAYPHLDLIVSPADGATLETVESFYAQNEVTGAKKMGRDWNIKTLATLTGKDYSYEFAEDCVTSYTIPEDKRPTEPGLYTLRIPKDYLLIGDDDPIHSSEFVASYAYVPKTQYVNVNYNVKTVVEEETSESTSIVQVVKGEAYSFRADKADSNLWAVNVEGATLDETSGTYSTGALEADATVTVTYTYTAPVTEYVTVNCKVKTVVGDEVAEAASTPRVVKGEAYGVSVQAPDSECWAVAVEGATLDETSGTYSTGALEADANVTVTYTYTAPEIVIPEYVPVIYSVSAKVGDETNLISENTALVEKGQTFSAAVNPLDKNWDTVVSGATLADNTVTTEALSEAAEVSVTYAYNGKVTAIEDLSKLDGTDWSDVKVSVNNGRISVSGLNAGETVMLYATNGQLLSVGTAQYDMVEFVAPTEASYIVSIVHNGEKLGVKVYNR